MIDLKYMAGFVDGEGCFNFSTPSKRSAIPRILITNTNYEVLLQIKNTFGGDISKSSVKDRPKWKSRYVWRLQNGPALKLAENLRPYLIVKKDQALTFMTWDMIRPGKGHKWDINEQLNLIKRMKSLNKKGN